jgi:hypothetical protein
MGKNYRWFIYLVIMALVGLHLFSIFFNLLITDEFETYATARFIHEGKIIFRDFFQHHGTIPYFIYSLVFLVSDNIYTSPLLMKAISLAIFGLILYLLFRFTRTLAGADYSAAIGFIPLYLILNDIIWWRFGLQIRTDNLMIVFLIATFYLLFQESKNQSPKLIFWAGFFASLVFFSKQNGLMLVAVFVIFYFQNQLKKYLIFLAGFIPLVAIHLIYFGWHRALTEFFNYFFLFNLLKSKYGIFSLSERIWFLSSSLTPLYVKLLYLLAFCTFNITTFLLFKKVARQDDRFFRALFFTAFLGLALTFCWKTPYPQYYLPVQIIFYLLGVYYLSYLKKFKKFIFRFTVVILFLSMPLVTFHYFKTTLKPNVNIFLQLRTIETIKNQIPRGARIIGPLPLMMVAEPAGFFWYFPPIFVDINKNFLNTYLNRADVVCYENNLFFFAPEQFKKNLFKRWFFIDRFYCPLYITERNLYEIVAFFARDGKLAKQIKENFQKTTLDQIAPHFNYLSEPVYIPLRLKILFRTGEKEIPLTKTGLVFQTAKPEKLTLEIAATTSRHFFDQSIKTYFPERPKITYSVGHQQIIIKIPYLEQMSTKEIIGATRSRYGYRPAFWGIIEINFSEKPLNITKSNLIKGYLLKADFFTRKLSLTIKSREEERTL